MAARDPQGAEPGFKEGPQPMEFNEGSEKMGALSKNSILWIGSSMSFPGQAGSLEGQLRSILDPLGPAALLGRAGRELGTPWRL